MGIKDIFKRSNVITKADVYPDDDNKGGSGGVSFEAKICNAGSEEAGLTVAAAFRAAELRSNSIASLRMRYLVRDRKNNYLKEDSLSEGSRINYVVGVRPNSRQNAFQFWKQVEMMRMFDGHAYILPVWGENGMLEELIPCKGTWEEKSNIYTLTNEAFRINARRCQADDVIVLRGVVTGAHHAGESIIRYAARTLSVSATTENLSLESAAKGGRHKVILKQKDNGYSPLMDPDKDELEKERQRFENSMRRDDVVLANGEVDLQFYSMSMADLQLLESRKFTVSDVARFFGVPRPLLMDDTNSNYKSAETASLDFMTRTLQPIIREIEDEFDSKLLTRQEYCNHRFRFDTSSLFALDVVTKNAYNKSRLETGVASVNELRAEMNMPSLENGDTHYVSCNVAPIGSAKLSGVSANNSPQEQIK